ncbi:MAG: ice-binding family protein [Acidobacteriota bacterium]|nr:ice-binding family protein [Acidobacteriota bacterium]
MKKRKDIGLTIIAIAAFSFFTLPAQAQVDPTLGLNNLRQFGVLGGAGVVGSTGLGTAVNGDVGSSPTASITNFVGSTIPGPSRTVPPFIVHYTNDLTVQAAIGEARTAWNNMGAQGLLPGAIPLGPQLNGQVLTPGVYNIGAADLAMNGTLTLNGSGIFIFVVASSLTANVGSIVNGTANPCNVFWRVGTSAVLNGNNFFGTVIADQAVTVSSNTQLSGRAVGIIASVTMPGGGGNTLGGCSAAAIVPPVGAAGGPTLDSVGRAILMLLLVGAGLFVMKKSAM